MPQLRSVRNLTSRVYPSPGSLAPWSARAETRSNEREASRGSMRTGVMLVVLALTLSLATAAAAQPLSGPEYIPLATPCRALDTRVTGTPLAANVATTIQIGGVTTGGANCGVPTTAVAAALYFAITQAQGAGHMTAWPSGDLPLTAAVNFVPGEDVGNEVDIGLGAGGTVLVQSIVDTHLVVDVYGYFTDVEELPGLNTALGERALFSNDTGTANTATGFFALHLNTTGNRNTATGAVALGNNTTGIANTATGFEALLMNLTGQSNTAAGSFALRNGISGEENTAMGNSALFNNTGQRNTAAGSLALLLSTTGSNNIAIGRAAGFQVTTGSNNIHIGNPGNQGTRPASSASALEAPRWPPSSPASPGEVVAGSVPVLIERAQGNSARLPLPSVTSATSAHGRAQSAAAPASSGDLSL